MSRAGLGRTRAGWRALRAERVSRASMLALRIRTSRSERPGEERRRCWNSSAMAAPVNVWGHPLPRTTGATTVDARTHSSEFDGSGGSASQYIGRADAHTLPCEVFQIGRAHV